MKKNYKRLNIKEYSKNAAKKFPYPKLIFYTALSFILTVLLFINIYTSKYQGTALIFTSIILILIAGYTYLNIKALIIKSKK